jgi:DNA-binding transcriptional LysR family regulator
MIDWDDLRIVLAVARNGSALRAAQALGVNQTTVMRRMTRLEAAIGAELFESRQTGYHLTPLGQSIAETAAVVEKEVKALEHALGAKQRALTGSVRVTTPEMLANILITPWLRTFRKSHPGILVELAADDRRLDLARGEADIALRASVRDREPPLAPGTVGRKLARVGWSLYCSRSYADEHGVPASVDEIARHAVVGFDGAIADLPGPRFLARVGASSRISARCNSLTNLLLTLRAGLGVSTLPCIAGDSDPELVRCQPPIAEIEGELWLVLREDAKSAPHIRIFADLLAAHVKTFRSRLAGE